MKVVIVGLGEVGSYLANTLSSEERFDVTGIDTVRNKIDQISDLYDIRTIEGYGAAPYVLKDAEVDQADLFIAVSNNDEVNLISALIARKLGAKFTIARVSNPFYLEKTHLEEYEDLGIDLLISPERRTALTIFQSIEYPQFLKVDTLGHGRIHINQYRISSQNPFANKKIKELSLSEDTLIVGINRRRDFIFPTGETAIYPNDTLFIVAKQETMKQINQFLPVDSKEIKRIILFGASSINYYLAKFAKNNFKVTLIESNEEKVERVASLLDGIEIYSEDIFNSNLLNELLVDEHDYFIAATDNDEMNLLSSILLKERGLSMIACVIHQSSLLSTIEKTGIQQVFSPQLIISNDIASTIRNQDLLSLQGFEDMEAEFVELSISSHAKIVGQKINQLSLPKQTLIVAIFRDHETFIPRGETIIEANDKIIVLGQKSKFNKIKNIFS